MKTDRALPAVLVTLTVVTGVVDAVSFLGLGRIFTANMTGNVVFLGFAAAGAAGLSIARSGAALGAFAAGAVLGGRMESRMRGGSRRGWPSAAFAIEAALLLASAAVAAGSGSDLTDRGTVLYAVILLTGLAMGIRNATVRKLGVADLTTTVLTLGIAGLAADSSFAGGANSGWSRRAGSVVAMVAGAALGAWLLRTSLAWALATAGALSAACALAARVSAANSHGQQA
ncbi:MAG: YoaK family protein [Myxococcales bacterium]